MPKGYKKLIDTWECDDEHICKFIEMDGCLECSRFHPMNELLYDIKHATDDDTVRDLVIEWMQAFD